MGIKCMHGCVKNFANFDRNRRLFRKRYEVGNSYYRRVTGSRLIRVGSDDLE